MIWKIFSVGINFNNIKLNKVVFLFNLYVIILAPLSVITLLK